MICKTCCGFGWHLEEDNSIDLRTKGKKGKFWFATRNDREVLVEWGPMDHVGRALMKTFKTTSLAVAFMRKMYREKTRHGYKENNVQ